MKSVIITLILVVSSLAQTPIDPPAIFPGGIATDAQLMNAVNSCQSTLNNAITAASVTATLVMTNGSNTTCFVANSLVVIDREVIMVSGVSGQTLSIVRGWDGTTAAVHAQYSVVSLASNVAWYHNALKSEIESIETNIYPLATPTFNGLHIGTGLLQTGTWSLSQGTGSGAHVWFQSTVANTGIKFHFWPNGSGIFSGIDYNNGSDTTGTNVGNLGISVNGPIAKIQTDRFGTGTGFTDLELGETNHPPPGTTLQRIGLYWDGVSKHTFTSIMATFPNITLSSFGSGGKQVVCMNNGVIYAGNNTGVGVPCP